MLITLVLLGPTGFQGDPRLRGGDHPARGRMLEEDLERRAVVIRRDREGFAEWTEHRRRFRTQRIAAAAGLGLEATARRLARNYQLTYGRPVGVSPRRGRVSLPSGRPGGRRLQAGRVGCSGGHTASGTAAGCQPWRPGLAGPFWLGRHRLTLRTAC